VRDPPDSGSHSVLAFRSRGRLTALRGCLTLGLLPNHSFMVLPTRTTRGPDLRSGDPVPTKTSNTPAAASPWISRWPTSASADQPTLWSSTVTTSRDRCRRDDVALAHQGRATSTAARRSIGVANVGLFMLEAPAFGDRVRARWSGRGSYTPTPRALGLRIVVADVESVIGSSRVYPPCVTV